MFRMSWIPMQIYGIFTVPIVGVRADRLCRDRQLDKFKESIV